MGQKKSTKVSPFLIIRIIYIYIYIYITFVVHENLYRQISSEIIGNKGKTILKQ